VSVDAPERPRATGGDTVGRVLASVDRAGDAAFRRLRGRPAVDAVAAVVSNLSDYGLVWIVLAAWKGRRPGPGRRRAVLELAGAGLSSYAVNKAVKRLVGRGRPGDAGTEGRVPVRRPTSTSFPSGHTLAAFCTAVVTSDTPSWAGLSLGFAASVAASRVHLRAHHPSDVLGGAVIGTATGLTVRTLLRRGRREA
jgi:undecaprenyl-diphosphatase